MDDLRIVSLLPSATEMLCALGLVDSIVGVTHECDYPPVVRTKPVVTRSMLAPGLSSAEIDSAVSQQHSVDAHALYTLDRDLLADLAPDIVVTQRLCDVCAVDYDEVKDTLATLPRQPELVTTEPSSLEDVLRDIERLGAITHAEGEARLLVHSLRARIERVRATVARAASGPRVTFLEWLDPLFRGGHWNPELVHLAGGEDALGNDGTPSTRLDWSEVLDYQPEVLVIACCGYSAERARQDLPTLETRPGYASLPAVRAGRIAVLDGSAYFSRPGPRLVDSLEILAKHIHPELFAEHD